MAFEAHYVNIEGAGAVRGTAVVLDVIRAYTTAAWAFALGAERIVLTDDTDEALALKARIAGSLAMKDSRPLPGFELSNSPVQLRAHDLRGLTIVQRTTHGTVGAVAAKAAEHLFCASFVNAAATARAVRATGAREAYFVITGEGGAGDEDQACAEYIAALVKALGRAGDRPGLNAGATRGGTGGSGLEPKVGHAGLNAGAGQGDTGVALVDVAPYLARVAASSAAGLIARRAAESVPGVDAEDLEAVMDVNRFDFVMRAREEQVEGVGAVLVLRRYDNS